jgi:uncharacterized protein
MTTRKTTTQHADKQRPAAFLTARTLLAATLATVLLAACASKREDANGDANGDANRGANSGGGTSSGIPREQGRTSFSPKPLFAYNADEILRLRRAKDAYFATDSLSPLPVFDKDRFKGLPYFEPTPAHCVVARFEPTDEKPIVVETTSSADYRRMKRVGMLRFAIGADSCVLAGYVDVESAKERAKSGFLPVLAVYFKDATNGNSTYEAGRYLELDYHEGAAAYTLDFNRAFSPYCAFNTLYSCPLVPRENILRVSIEAGEKTYQKP